ncbi:MAG: UDP-N-acetylmuramate dehydrogenase [Gammaproteobacteria bacterium]|nr:UDP-N-acetylmuramate dehydrogenase [Gammaproteobacteria bacterium]NNK33322.1 UDP-N-acetylmuramate dehydrogenase [Xanthomonadales bacterium]
MRALQSGSLRAFNSFGTEARAGLVLVIESEEDLLDLPGFDRSRDLLLGGGSNVLIIDDVPGTVYLNRIAGIHVLDDDGQTVSVEVGAGENWHGLVRWSLDQGLCGLENLSLIPGLAGAAPIQNIGAYGVELSSVLESVTAWDWQRGRWLNLPAADCGFAYRDSRFKSVEPDRYLITSIRLRLGRTFQPRLDYPGLAEELDAAGIRRPTAGDVSEAVCRIRRRKLPDPAVTGNAGSFFKNPVLPADDAAKLLQRFPGMPSWPAGEDRLKLAAAWMIERCGFKGAQDGAAGVSERHALVLVNHGAASGREIAALARRIRLAVEERFGLRLEFEPRLVEFGRD